jgi:hypothetical protein
MNTIFALLTKDHGGPDLAQVSNPLRLKHRSGASRFRAGGCDMAPIH